MRPMCIRVPPPCSPLSWGDSPRQYGGVTSRAQHLGRQYGLWLVVPVGEPDALAHVLPTGLGVHHFGEDLQTVAVGVEEVDAVGHAVVSRVVDLGAMLDEPAVELAELRLAALDLEGDVVEAQRAHLSALGGLEEGNVVVLGTKGQEGGAVFPKAHDFHTQSLSVKLHGRLYILHIENYVPYLINSGHVTLLELREIMGPTWYPFPSPTFA